MDSLARSDAFFIITSIAVIVVSAVSLVAIFVLIKIFKNIRDISQTVKIKIQNIAKDIENHRKLFKQGGRTIISLLKKMSEFLKK